MVVNMSLSVIIVTSSFVDRVLLVDHINLRGIYVQILREGDVIGRGHYQWQLKLAM
jgi:hypothetical protein